MLLKAVIPTSSGVSFGWFTICTRTVFVPRGDFVVNSIGIMVGAGPMVPLTAVRWSPVIGPMEPPAFTIFVEARSDESVVRTRLRAIGSCTLPRFKNGWPQRKTLSPWIAVTVHAELIE